MKKTILTIDRLTKANREYNNRILLKSNILTAQHLYEENRIKQIMPAIRSHLAL